MPKLVFADVNYEETVADSIRDAEHVRVFECHNCQLVEVPDVLNKWSSTLTGLSLSRNQLTHLPETFADFTELRNLNLSYNPGLGFPTLLTRLPRLGSISLHQNGVRTIPEEIGQLQQLQRLSLLQNPIDPASLVHLKNCPALQVIDLSYCNLYDFPVALQRMSQLKELTISDNGIQQLPDWLPFLGLESLDLSANKLYHVPESFREFGQELRYLSLGGNPIPLAEVEQLREWLPQTEISFWQD